MGLAEALYYELSNDSGVTAQVSTRIYQAGDVPQGAALPYIVLQQVDSVPSYHMTAEADIAQSRWQIDSYGATPYAARTVAAAIKSCLSFFRDDMGQVGNTVAVRATFLDSERHDYTQPADADQRGPHRISQDYLLWHRS